MLLGVLIFFTVVFYLVVVGICGWLMGYFYSGHGYSANSVALDSSAVYELIWQGVVDNKPQAVLVEMHNVQDLTSQDRTIKLYRLDAPLPEGVRYFKVKEENNKNGLVPFVFPGGVK